MALLNFFHKSDDAILGERFKPLGWLPWRQARRDNTTLIERAKVVGLDPATILVLLQVFGPLLQKAVEMVVKWLESRQVTAATVIPPGVLDDDDEVPLGTM